MAEVEVIYNIQSDRYFGLNLNRQVILTRLHSIGTVSYTHLYSRPIVFGEDRLRERGSLPTTFF